MAKKKERSIKGDFNYNAAQTDYRFQLKRKPSLWWLLLLLLPLLLLLLLLSRDRQPEVPIDDSPPPVPQTGDVQILLKWSNCNDLDLACVDPYGEEIYYGNQNSESGGVLDIDMNASEPYRTDPIENIYWPTGSAPEGQYTVYLTYFNRHDSERRTPYEVIVKHGGQEDHYTGTMHWKKERIEICTFTID